MSMRIGGSIMRKNWTLTVDTSAVKSRVPVRSFMASFSRLNNVPKPNNFQPKDIKPREVVVKPKLEIKPIEKVDPIVKTADPLVVPIPPKKKFSFTGFFFKYGLLAAVIYGGVMYVATINDKVMDFVIDQQLPYYEPIIDVIEHGSVEDLQKKLEELVDSVKNFSFPSQGRIHDITNKGEKIYQNTKHKLENVSSKGSKGKLEIPADVKDATPAQQLQKPVETVQKPRPNLPLITLNKVESKMDESLKSTVDSFNQFIKSIELNTPNTAGKDGLIKVINENVSKLSTKLNDLTKSFDETLQLKMKDSQTELLTNFTKKELELSETLLDQFNHEKSSLEKKLNNRLSKEIQATKEAINQAAVNAVSMMRVEQTKQFEQLIKTKIDNERNGRLANLTALNDRLKELEEFSVNLENQLTANHNKGLLSKSILNLKHVLSSESPEKPALLLKYFANVEKSSEPIDDDLIKVALGDLKSLLVPQSNILSNSQIVSRWDELTPELRSASLLPPNAGLLGHLSSLLFSKLLLPVKGAKPNGKDIESVIGRIDASLARGDLDVAIEEAANLKGWPRKLADDWVKEGRKRLEIEFLVDVLESESRIV